MNTDLPNFEKVDIQALEASIKEIISENKKALQIVASSSEAPTFANFIEPLEALDISLNNQFSIISHLNHVKSTSEVRDAYDRLLPELTDYSVMVGQNRQLFDKFEQLLNSPGFSSFSVPQQTIIKHTVQNFKLSGVALTPEKKQVYKVLQEGLSSLCNDFSKHVMDATDAWRHVIKNVEELAGVPQAVIKAAHHDGEYVLGLDFPTYQAILTYAENRALREFFHRAYTTRASKEGGHDESFNNDDYMVDILQRRQQLAELLDFDSYAAMSVVTEMVENVQTVDQFYKTIISKAYPAAKKDFESLELYAKEQGAELPLKAWDISFYSERLQKDLFDIDQEALRDYFPLSRVLSGLFEIVHRLFGIKIEEVKNVSTWHDSVHCYVIKDQHGELRGHFYTDLFARPQKQSGAWMDNCRDRIGLSTISQSPIAHLVCNFRAPSSGQDAYLTHDDVVTLFHEFGHTCHHLLTKMVYPSVSGIHGVSQDAVELPSQFLENWCWEKESLALISAHKDTGAAMPEQTLKSIKSAKSFQSGMFLVRQIEFGLFDWRIHSIKNLQTPESIQKVLDGVRVEVAVVPTISENKFQNTFTHIFSGGYSAGYYSYLWAEVLSADAFEAFLETSLFDQKTGSRFLHSILERGGSEPAGDLFKEFRGRTTDINAFLKQHALA